MYHWQQKNWPQFEYDTTRFEASVSEYSKKAYSIEGVAVSSLETLLAFKTNCEPLTLTDK